MAKSSTGIYKYAGRLTEEASAARLGIGKGAKSSPRFQLAYPGPEPSSPVSANLSFKLESPYLSKK